MKKDITGLDYTDPNISLFQQFGNPKCIFSPPLFCGLSRFLILVRKRTYNFTFLKGPILFQFLTLILPVILYRIFCVGCEAYSAQNFR